MISWQKFGKPVKKIPNKYLTAEIIQMLNAWKNHTTKMPCILGIDLFYARKWKCVYLQTTIK